MLHENILLNLEKLPIYYQQEVLDFSDFLLSKVKQSENSDKEFRGGFGLRKGEYIMSDDFDEPLDDFKEYMQ